jgi:starch phosphorylase
VTVPLTGPHDGRRDLERAIAALAERLPGPLSALARVAYNYRWSWMEGAAALFNEIDPLLWQRSAGNTRWVIESATPARLRQLAERPDFVARVEHCATLLDADLKRPHVDERLNPQHPIAYFCSEFGIHSSLPIYGGGLGILAGDILKAASDLTLPFAGVGLLYRYGYFRQRLDAAGWQHEYWTPTDIERLPAALVTGANDEPFTVRLVIRDRSVTVQVWRLDVGRVPLYLLDTDRPDNDPRDRWITARLYVGDRETRLAQYAVLGIGGARVLREIGIQPALVHLNEGHAALSGLERLRQACSGQQQRFVQALAELRAQTVFTTHTPVPAGNEAYTVEEIEAVLARFIDDLGLSRTQLFDLGRVVPGEDEPLNLTALALRLSGAANGVSRRHGEVARAMWAPLFPEHAPGRVPITHVTNGVHTFTWMAVEMQALLDRHLGTRWRERVDDPAVWEGIETIPAAELWSVRCQLRSLLVERAREQSIRDRLARGESPDYVGAAARVFDPSVLTIGFARRVATYKRLYLLARRPEQGLLRLLDDGRPPIQIIIAGKAHPQDNVAKEALRDAFQYKREQLVARRVIFLEDYDLQMAPCLVAGVDLWLNLPRPPMEASGTSGMKVVLNGGLNLSVLDGWWAEAFDGSNGWAIESIDADPYTQDDHDAARLFSLLEDEVVPLFYDRDANGLPLGWIQRLKASMRTLVPRFSAERMLREYLATLYAQPLENVRSEP